MSIIQLIQSIFGLIEIQQSQNDINFVQFIIILFPIKYYNNYRTNQKFVTEYRKIGMDNCNHLKQQLTGEKQITKVNKVQNSDRKLRSIKSQACLNNLNRNHEGIENFEINLKFQELRVLTKQKDQLMNELNRLKDGACSALLEKQEIIDKLKNSKKHFDYFEDEKQQMQKQITSLIRKNKSLMQERKENSQKLQKQRTFFFEDLYNKEVAIQQLTIELERMHEENLRLIEENGKLVKLLTLSENNVSCQIQQISQLKQQVQKLQNVIKLENTQNNQQIIQQKLYSRQAIEHSKQYLLKQIELLKLAHEKQLYELGNFYQNQVNIMRAIFQKQFNQNGLKKTFDSQFLSTQEQNEQLYQLFTLHSGFGTKTTNGFQLNHDIKQLNSIDRAQEEQSQITKKYLNTFKVLQMNIKESSEQEKIENDSEEQQKNNNIQNNGSMENRLVYYCVGSGLCGVAVGAILSGILRK